MRFTFLFLCAVLAGVAGAAPQKTTLSNSDDAKRSAERDKIMSASRKTVRAHEKSLRQREQEEIRSLNNDSKRSDAGKKALTEEITKKYSLKRMELRRRMNADLRARLLTNSQEE